MGITGSRVFPMKRTYPVQYRKSCFPHGMQVTLVRTVGHLSPVKLVLWSILKQPARLVHVPPKHRCSGQHRQKYFLCNNVHYTLQLIMVPLEFLKILHCN